MCDMSLGTSTASTTTLRVKERTRRVGDRVCGCVRVRWTTIGKPEGKLMGMGAKGVGIAEGKCATRRVLATQYSFCHSVDFLPSFIYISGLIVASYLQYIEYYFLYLVNGTGNPQVSPAEPVPIPVETRTRGHGYGFCGYG